MVDKVPYGREFTFLVGGVLVVASALALSNLTGPGVALLRIYPLIALFVGIGLLVGATRRPTAFYWTLSRVLAAGAFFVLLAGIYALYAGLRGGELAPLFIAVFGLGGLLLALLMSGLSRGLEQDRRAEASRTD